MQLEAGTVLAGRYRIEARLGEGGMGAVYRAHDEQLGRPVAVKLLHASLAADGRSQERFHQEARSMAALNHPNVVGVHDRGEHDGAAFLVMAYVSGSDLRRTLAGGVLSLDRTVAVVRDVAAGLDAAHALGLVHRDVKPANVLLTHGPGDLERALVTDFGIALPSERTASLTSAGSVVGTAAYVAPEQLRGGKATPVSDVYGLACVAFECLTGRPPFVGTEAEIARGHLGSSVPALKELRDLPEAAARVVERGLAKDPRHRYQRAGEFARALEVAADTRSGEGRSGVPPRRDTTVTMIRGLVGPDEDGDPVRSAGRRGVVAGGVVAAVFLLSAAGGFLTGSGEGAPPDPAPSSSPISSADPASDRYDALVAKLPTNVFASCEPQSEREGGAELTSLTCSSPLPGIDELLVSQWSSEAALTDDFQRTYGDKPNGRCGSYAGAPAEGLRTTWESGRSMTCYINDPGAAVLLWDYPESAVRVLGIRTDGSSLGLFSWWRAHRPDTLRAS